MGIYRAMFVDLSKAQFHHNKVKSLLKYVPVGQSEQYSYNTTNKSHHKQKGCRLLITMSFAFIYQQKFCL